MRINPVNFRINMILFEKINFVLKEDQIKKKSSSFLNQILLFERVLAIIEDMDGPDKSQGLPLCSYFGLMDQQSCIDNRSSRRKRFGSIVLALPFIFSCHLDLGLH